MKKNSQIKKTKQPSPRFQIFTEGDVSEKNYIDAYIALKHPMYYSYFSIEKPKDHSPYGLFKAAKMKIKSSEYDKNLVVQKKNMWIVFDRDAHKKIQNVFNDNCSSGVNIAFSSISFETWLLMHLTYTTKAFNCADALCKHEVFEARLPKYETLTYEEAQKLVREKLNIAIKNSKQLCKTAKANDPKKQIYEHNPYTNFYELLEAIDSFVNEIKKREEAEDE